MNLFEELKWRGLIKDISSPELAEKLNAGGMTFYIGTDPTGDSMHIGHFSSFLIAKRLKDAGHNPILLIGGATGLIGDPKPSSERPMITKEEVNKNVVSLTKQAKEIFGFEVVNNYDWCKDVNFIDFLRDYGKYFNINYMLNKETIKSRLETGITYTEFSYMILQALDFLYLFENKNCTLQVAGQDQWGNITAGIELIRKKTSQEAYSFTMPLLTKADGVKFGKTEGNAVWLDKNKTSSYELYQFFINSEDEKVIDYLKFLTFLSKEEIEKLTENHEKEPHLRLAHKALAREVITFLHGADEYNHAVMVSEKLFSDNIKDLTVKEITAGFTGVPTFKVELNIPIIDLLINNNITNSKREARELLSAGAILVNGEKIVAEHTLIDKEMLIDNQILVLKRGKKNYFLGRY